MFSHEGAFGKSLHRLSVCIPYEDENDEVLVEMAIHHMEAHFDQVEVSDGLAQWVINNIPHIGPVVLISAYPPEIRELDLTTVYGVGLYLHLKTGRLGIAVMVDGDTIIL